MRDAGIKPIWLNVTQPIRALSVNAMVLQRAQAMSRLKEWALTWTDTCCLMPRTEEDRVPYPDGLGCERGTTLRRGQESVSNRMDGSCYILARQFNPGREGTAPRAESMGGYGRDRVSLCLLGVRGPGSRAANMGL